MKISEISREKDKESIQTTSIDLVASARRHLAFLKTVAESSFLYSNKSLCQANRRYDELWMPLISDLSDDAKQPLLLPPLDVQWVWHCHTLNPGKYRRYCQLRFSKILEKPVIHDNEIEEYALNRCSDVWSIKYPFEPFELEESCDDKDEMIITKEDIFREVWEQKALYSKFSEPYMVEVLYLISAKKRFIQFMYLLQKFKDGCDRLIPTLDIQLMWLTYMSYPATYAKDVNEKEEELEKVVGIWEEVKDGDVQRSIKVWEEVFDEPYEKAGATLDSVVGCSLPPVYWAVSDADVNTKYKLMETRFLSEVCVFTREKSQLNLPHHGKHDYIRLRPLRCHKDFKIDRSPTYVRCDSWKKACHIYCEFKTRGLVFEHRRRSTGCLKNEVRSSVAFLWNDLIRAPCLTIGKDLGKEVSIVVSITPPVQAPYLLKCVPDKVTDDSGAMISDEILRMNRYRPQEGRWLSRTVLDHTGKECFVVRIRVASGIWRRGGEVPVVVKPEDRVIEIREGSWSYVGGSIGKAPGKVAGTAKPNEISKEKASWSLSTGDELTLHRISSGFTFGLQNRTSTDAARLIQGRKLQYQVNCKDEGREEEEGSFVTLVRYTPGNPNERATALINWRLAVMEFLPEEDTVMVLLLCMAILRSVSEMVGEDMGNLLVRRRLQEPRSGTRDWGSIVMHPSYSSASSSYCSPHLQPWHWNAKEVMAPVDDHNRRQTAVNYSPAEGGDKLYKRVIIP